MKNECKSTAVVASVQSKHETIMHLQTLFNKSLFIYMNFTESSVVADVLCCLNFLVELILATLDFLLMVHRAVAKCRVAIFVSHVCLQMSLEIFIGSGILPLSTLFYRIWYLMTMICNSKLKQEGSKMGPCTESPQEGLMEQVFFLWKRILFHGRTFLLSVLTAWE